MGFFEFYFSSLIGIIFFILSLALYFLPTIIAIIRKKRNALAIFMLNFFLGWTFIGWVVSLVWSVTRD
ncbi:MAG: superinfection immunity protein [Dehalococcoidales bacterium]|nr:superinfection immunity protein [Dehalococcoidales bacterium]